MLLRARFIPLLTLLCVGCAPDPTTTVFIQSHTEQGLLQLPKEIAVARLGTLKGEGTSAYFTSSILPASSNTVHSSGRLSVARGSVEMTFTDSEGHTQAVRASPGKPGEWKADVRAMKPRDGKVGFPVKLQPLEGQPPQADGILLEVTYTPG